MPPDLTTAERELLPCPFCGGTNARPSPIRDGTRVECPECFAAGPARFAPKSHEQAIAAWQARAGAAVAQPSPDAEVAEVIVAIDAELAHIANPATGWVNAIINRKVVIRARDALARWQAAQPVALPVARIVAEQAEDNGIWFVPQTCAEDYLQRALRRLHAAIEGVTPEDSARAALAEPPKYSRSEDGKRVVFLNPEAAPVDREGRLGDADGK